MSDDAMLPVTVTRTCPDCGIRFEAQTFSGFPDLGPSRCPVHQDAHAALVLEARRQAEIRERRVNAKALAIQSGIAEKFMFYDKARDSRGYLSWISANRTRSLFLSGPSDQGKTHCLAYAGYRSILDYGDRVLFLRAPAWFRRVGALMGSDAWAAELEITKAKEAQLLILDDFGKERLTDRAAEVVWDIIDLRERDGRRTWISTNASGDELKERLGADRGYTVLVRVRRSYVEFNTKTKG
jgi:DNA replication protein DnaC